MNKYQFEEARIAWRENGGIVSGYDVEYENLAKVCKAKKLKIDEVVPLLLSAVKSYFAYCKQRKADGVFCESPSSFTVYTNNQRWTREYPVSKYRTSPQIRKCGFCGKPSTRSKLVYFKDGAANVARCNDCEFPEDVK